MSTSYPYLTLALERGVSYSAVLSYVDWLDGGPALAGLARAIRGRLDADDMEAIMELRDAELRRRTRVIMAEAAALAAEPTPTPAVRRLRVSAAPWAAPPAP